MPNRMSPRKPKPKPARPSQEPKIIFKRFGHGHELRGEINDWNGGVSQPGYVMQVFAGHDITEKIVHGEKIITITCRKQPVPEKERYGKYYVNLSSRGGLNESGMNLAKFLYANSRKAGNFEITDGGRLAFSAGRRKFLLEGDLRFYGVRGKYYVHPAVMAADMPGVKPETTAIPLKFLEQGLSGTLKKKINAFLNAKKDLLESNRKYMDNQSRMLVSIPGTEQEFRARATRLSDETHVLMERFLQDLRRLFNSYSR